MLKRRRDRKESSKENEMNTHQPTRGNGSTTTVLLIIGGTMMLIALAGAFGVYLWGRMPPSGGGEQWNDVIAGIYIVFGALPVFLIGVVLLLIGLFRKGGSKGKAAQGDQ